MLQCEIGLTLLRGMRHFGRRGRRRCGRERNPSLVTEESGKPQPTVVIKKYANRRLYNTATSTYVTLDDLARMVRDGINFTVADAKSGEDITRSVLTQIIFEEENKGQNLLPINFLRQLIRFYGDSMQAFVPSYLEFSIDALTREQERFRKQLMESFGVVPFRAMEEQAKRNVAMFQQAMKMFNPFVAGGGEGEMAKREAAGEAAPPAAPGTSSVSQDDIKSLREQLDAVQRQLDALASKKH
jgi:polyhydroxyalkanoate synthesis repressor PhaR